MQSVNNIRICYFLSGYTKVCNGEYKLTVLLPYETYSRTAHDTLVLNGLFLGQQGSQRVERAIPRGISQEGNPSFSPGVVTILPCMCKWRCRYCLIYFTRNEAKGNDLNGNHRHEKAYILFKRMKKNCKSWNQLESEATIMKTSACSFSSADGKNHGLTSAAHRQRHRYMPRRFFHEPEPIGEHSLSVLFWMICLLFCGGSSRRWLPAGRFLFACFWYAGEDTATWVCAGSM